MKNIVIYARVSTTLQDYQSQIDDLEKWCTRNEFNVVEKFGEQKSGYDLSAEREEYDKMKDYVIKHKIKNIITWEISRFSRSMVKLVNEIDWFTKNHINVHFKKEGLDSYSNTVTNQMLLAILGGMAEMERNTFIERSERGRVNGVKKGKMIGYATNPYGYTTDTGEKGGIITIEPTEAKAVKMMFEMAIKGDTLYSIAQHLNSIGVPTRLQLEGKTRSYKDGSVSTPKWTPVTVRKILNRTLYKGVRIYKDEETPVPAIVTVEMWEKVQERFKQKVGYHNRTKYKYLFKSKMKCGRCNRMMVSHTSTRNSYQYYECAGIGRINHPCSYKSHTIKSHIIDYNIYNLLFEHKYVNQIMSQETSEEILKKEKVRQIDYYKSEIKTLEKEGEKFLYAFTKGHIPEDKFDVKMTQIKTQKTELGNKVNLLEEEIKAILKVNIKSVINKYKNSSSFVFKREFVNKYVNNVLVYRVDDAKVEWETPLRKNEKIIYCEVYAFNFKIPLKVLLTPHTKNVYVSSGLSYLDEYNIVVETLDNISIKETA